ncbi:hypothetical protein KUF71_005194 [Frankliniella fusca]|uniref:Uncharacterized protein n=1 Tax=Frankliniella fusca TaxID=407009 RepID=A0AAE1HZY4_9NEOP|nr:hypothetical protein KUF71_005194 [Frankliniella fusca]
MPGAVPSATVSMSAPMELLWAPPHARAAAGPDGEPERPAVSVVRSKCSVISLEQPLSPALSYRVLVFALLGLVVNVHGAVRGRSDWVLRYDGSFARASAQRFQRPGVSVSVGLGGAHAYASAAACLLLLAALLTARRWLSLPALLLTASDLLGDVSDAVVTTYLLVLYSGLYSAAVYSLFAGLVIALEFYLWSGALRWYEQGLDLQLKLLERRLRGRVPPSAASSASSVMD